MSQAPAGWYPDPSGIPNAFRWWNGGFWTTALSASAGAPAPVNPAPAQPAGGQPAGAGSTGQGSTGTDFTPGQSAVQPGYGNQQHPGPDYEPAAWRLTPGSSPEYGPGGPLPPAHGSGGMSTRAIVAVFAGVFVAAVVAGGLYLALNNRGEPGPARPTTAQQTPGPASPTTLATPGQTPPATPGQTPEASPGQTPPATPGQTPTPGPTGGPTPQPAPPQQPFTQAHLEFVAPGAPWDEEQLTSLLGATVWQWQGFNVVTEKDYNPPGTEDWTAIMVSGTPSGDFGIENDPQKGLRAFSDWYKGSFFANSKVTVKQVSSKKITVDGQDAWQLVLDYSYSVTGLKATSERVTLVGLRTPDRRPRGVRCQHPEHQQRAEQVGDRRHQVAARGAVTQLGSNTDDAEPQGSGRHRRDPGGQQIGGRSGVDRLGGTVQPHSQPRHQGVPRRRGSGDRGRGVEQHHVAHRTDLAGQHASHHRGVVRGVAASQRRGRNRRDAEIRAGRAPRSASRRR